MNETAAEKLTEKIMDFMFWPTGLLLKSQSPTIVKFLLVMPAAIFSAPFVIVGAIPFFALILWVSCEDSTREPR